MRTNTGAKAMATTKHALVRYTRITSAPAIARPISLKLQ
jgi:hypothetical protein